MRGKEFSPDDLTVIIHGLKLGRTATEIAVFLNRAPRSVRKRIERMRLEGLIDGGRDEQ